MGEFAIEPVGFVRSTRGEVFDDGWDAESVAIELDPARFGPEALWGVDQFSHVEVVFVFDRVAPETVEHGARHPRNNPDWPRVGIFGQRGKNRPNRLGLSVCRVLGVDGTTLHVGGLDAVDGSPVVDIKPWMAEFGPRGDVRQPEWSTELMSGYW